MDKHKVQLDTALKPQDYDDLFENTPARFNLQKLFN